VERIVLKSIFNSFRSRILLSFLVLKVILVSWIVIYYYINSKEQRLQELSSKLFDVQNQFLASNRFLQHFMLSGYQQPSFYQTNSQVDIDTFLLSRHHDIAQINKLKVDAAQFNLNLSEALDTLSILNNKVINESEIIKSAYYQKGFKDFGLEGRMRIYAHYIEDSTQISKVDILQLRRHEKDFLLRGEKKYYEEFEAVMQKLLQTYQINSLERSKLLNYKSTFENLVKIYLDLGIHSNSGKYEEVNRLINQIDNQYTKVNSIASIKINNLRENFMLNLIAASIFSLILAIISSIYLSQKLTKGIKNLDERMFAFVKSRFKSEDNKDVYVSNITEISRLNKDFTLLKNTLKETLNDLEDSFQNAKAASEAKGIFLANMSHEIRTPLNGIIGMAHILKSEHLNEEQKSNLETMEFSANHLLELINSILDYSKIEAGKLKIEKVSFDLESDLTKLVKIFDYKIIEQKLKLTLNFNADNGRFKIGDSIRIQQILINLINNAVKFTKEGEIKVSVSEIFNNVDRQKLRFEISDTGIGIAPDKIETLFKAFEQGDASITRNYGGTGLGLTIASQLLNLLNSSLHVSSEVGKGSVFSFEIELIQGELITHKITSVINSTKKSDKLNILLAEDNLINQKVLVMMIKQNNAEVIIANNGLEAVDLYQQNNFDMIFMDIQMPVMDGFEATLKIRGLQANMDYIPIIAITANAFSEDREKAFAVGMDDFITKPVKPLELKGIIEKFSQDALSLG
jgi:signal transduction histidine kinase/CheY-like chemotaxis protein